MENKKINEPAVKPANQSASKPVNINTVTATADQPVNTAAAAAHGPGHAIAADAKSEAMLSLSPESTNGDKIRALRLAQHMSLAELSRRSGMTGRAIRYMEDNERTPSVEAIQKISAALGVTTDYFMDDVTFEQELKAEQFYAEARRKYGSRGVAQAKRIREQTSALFAGGDLSEEDRQAFIEDMEELFFEAKEDAKKFTPKKYRQ